MKGEYYTQDDKRWLRRETGDHRRNYKKATTGIFLFEQRVERQERRTQDNIIRVAVYFKSASGFLREMETA